MLGIGRGLELLGGLGTAVLAVASRRLLSCDCRVARPPASRDTAVKPRCGPCVRCMPERPAHPARLFAGGALTSCESTRRSSRCGVLIQQGFPDGRLGRRSEPSLHTSGLFSLYLVEALIVLKRFVPVCRSIFMKVAT